jgi:two-component system chemotaxis sensor kinase CheA
MNEFIEQFLLEARELAEQATQDLLALESNPDDRNRLDGAFRAFHTLKGGAGIVDFDALARAMHAAEDALGDVRARRAPIDAKLIGNCLFCIDHVVRWLDAMEASGEIPPDADATAETMVIRFGKNANAVPEKPSISALQTQMAWTQALFDQYPALRGTVRTAVRYTPDAGSFFRGEDSLEIIANVPGLAALALSPNGTWPVPELFDPFACQTILSVLSTETIEVVTSALANVADQVEIAAVTPGDGADMAFPQAARAVLEAQIVLLGVSDQDGLVGRIASAGRVAVNVLQRIGRVDATARMEKALAQSQERREPQILAAALRDMLAGTADGKAKPSQASAPSREEAIARSLRVDVARIDALVKLTGELTIVKNAIGHAAALAQDGADVKTVAKVLKEQRTLLDGLVAELQRSVLSIRMLPLRHVFQRFPRLVRELAENLGKPTKLIIKGEETEADKAIVEILFEPLLHIIRNAMDHGIEIASERTAGGKPSLATVLLHAGREGEHVIVEVRDDGQGMDPSRIRQVAVERGVIATQAATSLTDAEALDLIFAPGFSTAAAITDVSGRGVGMDAVRAAVERVGGRVQVHTQFGQGTAVRLMLPFTVMMTRVLIVEAGGQAFGIPLDSVVETIRIPRDVIAAVGAAHAFVLRDRTIPVISLAHSLGRETGAASAEATILVVSVAGHWAGIEVDRVGDQQDVMLKPMEGLLAGMRGVSGTTLLGNGRVLIVLDIGELLE